MYKRVEGVEMTTKRGTSLPCFNTEVRVLYQSQNVLISVISLDIEFTEAVSLECKMEIPIGIR